jgi:hypothetical protein
MPPSMSSTLLFRLPDIMSDGWDLQNVLTNLAVRVGQLEGTITTFMNTWRTQDDAAGLGRRVTHEKIELISLQVERLANDIRGVQQDIAELKLEVDEEIMPSIQVSKYARERKAGANSVWALIGAGVVAAASLFAYLADKLMQYIRHP